MALSAETQSGRRRDSDTLERFRLEGVRDTGVTIGDGSYATVKALEFCGLKCVGKKIHALMYELANEHEKAELVHRFAGECELLSRLHHPCIVQFLGVYFERDSRLPVMVMEYLHTTLAHCLDRYGVLPEEISYGILQDVALGLRYLHEYSPPIIHRDLSANNVLLATDMRAKISDLGVAKILNLSPAQITQRMATKAPGTPCYMPPEALISMPSYTSKIDSYSYGVLMTHVLCGHWPFPGDAFLMDPENPGSFLPVNEFDRRLQYLREIGLDHPLIGLIRQCLSNAPATRPEATDILRQIEAVSSQVPPQFENKMEMIRHDQSQRTEVENLRKEIHSLSVEQEAQREQILSLTEQLESQKKLLPTPSSCPTGDSVTTASDSLSEPLHPQVSLQWKRQADLPVRTKQRCCVAVGGKVYAGGGYVRKGGATKDDFLVFHYDPDMDAWDRLPPCPLKRTVLGEFQGHLVAVGGATRQDVLSGMVYRYVESLKKWEKCLKPMPVARWGMALISTDSALIVCAGRLANGEDLSTVDVYAASTQQWHSGDPLPSCFYFMTATTIGDTCYLLGGDDKSEMLPNAVLSAPINSLVKKAVSPPAEKESLWTCLAPTPLSDCTAASLGGRLLAIGGIYGQHQKSPSVHMFDPSTNSWVRLPSSDLPVALCLTTAFTLADSKILVCGGCDDKGRFLKTVYVGSPTS